MSLSTIIVALCQMLSLIILTRYLSRADFGIVAIVSMILGVIHTLSDLGFSAAVMHERNISEKEFSSLYWIQLFIYSLMYVISILLSPLISVFYSEPSLTYLIPISLSALIFMGIGVLYNTMLQKNKEFKIIAIRNIVASVISLCTAVLLAIGGGGVYSLILSVLLQTIIVNIWNFLSGRRYIKLQYFISVRKTLPLVKMGLYLTGTQLVDYIASKFDIIIIGKLLGTENLGVYNLVKELVQKVVSLVNTIANKVALPYLADLQDDKTRIGALYCSFIHKISLINFPICVFLGSLSSLIIPILYSDNYLDAIPLLTVLAIWGMLVSIGNPINNIVIAVGRTDLSFKYTIIRVMFTIPVLILASFYNIFVVALATLGCELVMSVVSWYMELWKTISLRFQSFFSVFTLNLVVSTLTIVLVNYFILHSFLTDMNHYACLVVGSIITIIVFFFLTCLFNKSYIKEIYRMYHQVLFKKGAVKKGNESINSL